MKTIDFMSYKIVYLDEAKQDVKEAKSWYKKQRDGLQKQFAQEVIAAISRLKNHPVAFAIRYKNVRVAHTKTFPYGIHFYIHDVENLVIITAIIHDSRNDEETIRRPQLPSSELNQ